MRVGRVGAAISGLWALSAACNAEVDYVGSEPDGGAGIAGSAGRPGVFPDASLGGQSPAGSGSGLSTGRGGSGASGNSGGSGGESGDPGNGGEAGVPSACGSARSQLCSHCRFYSIYSPNPDHCAACPADVAPPDAVPCDDLMYDTSYDPSSRVILLHSGFTYSPHEVKELLPGLARLSVSDGQDVTQISLPYWSDQPTETEIRIELGALDFSPVWVRIEALAVPDACGTTHTLETPITFRPGLDASRWYATCPGGEEPGTQRRASTGCGAAVNTARPSCTGLAPSCGPCWSGDCCAASLVNRGTFTRGLNGEGGPATVSDFVLDKYPITVGRFEQFIASYPANLPAAGAGKNPHDPSDSGWDSAWNASLPADRAALVADLECGDIYRPSGFDHRDNVPANCLSWYEAFAFCIWDGGRLPTRAEWEYAAVGGAEQRYYPWSVPPQAVDNGRDYSPWDRTALFPVGSFSPKGDGRWGQSDFASANQASEWARDSFAEPQPTPCVDCASLDGPGNTVLTIAGPGPAAQVGYARGAARCARSAP